MAENVKITKRDYYNTLRNLVNNTMFAADAEIGADKLLEFIDHEVDLINQRAEKSRVYQQEHKASNDAMSDMIVEVLKDSDVALSVPDIVAKIVDSTPQKIIYRLGRLAKSGKIVKDTQTVREEGLPARRISFYTIAEA